MTTRRKFIIDVIEKYKSDYPLEFYEFTRLMEQRRSEMKDKKHGGLNGASEIRNALSLPDKLANTLFYVMDGVKEPKFLEPKGEMKWFVKKFPEFLLPMSY